MFTGGYGCGKSMIVHQQIQRYQEKENSILCYLGMDEYSLHQVLVDEHCAKVSERLKQKIVSKSVVDVSLDAGSSNKLLTLSECLAEIQKSHPDKQIDVVVDELDCEDLNRQEVVQLKRVLKSPGFKSSMFYISLQSCQKKRQLKHNKEQKETKSHYKDLGIETFHLKKTMRFTTNIGNAVQNSQEIVEKKRNVYLCDFQKQVEIEERHTDEMLPESTTPDIEFAVGVNEVGQKFESEESVDSNRANLEDNHNKPKLNSMRVSTMKMDASLKHFEEKNSSTQVISYFEYFKTNGSGVNIQGEKPRLLRLDDKKSIQPLAFFLNEYCRCEKKMMIICNTKETINLAKAAMETVELTYVEYTDSIRGLPAKTTLSKKSILKEWRDDKQVLLVDCRGCRGMECQEVYNKYFIFIFLSYVERK